MKVFIVLVLSYIALVQCASDEELAKRVVHKVECIKETKIEGELVQKIKDGQVVDEPLVRDFMLCYSKKSGFIDDENKLHVENIKSHLEDEYGATIAAKLLKACGDKVGETARDTAFAVGKCLTENKPHHHA